MVQRADFVRILFLCVCMCHVCPASPCGGNPMRSVETFAGKHGFETPHQLLDFMRLNTPSDYSSFIQQYRRYLDCTQMLQTGTFKRSADFLIDDTEIPSDTFSEEEQLIDKRERNRIEQNLVSATVGTRPKIGTSSLLSAELKRKWDEYRKRGSPKWRKEGTIALEPILDRKTSSLLKRLLSSVSEEASLVGTDPVYKKSNLYTEINSRRR